MLLYYNKLMIKTLILSICLICVINIDENPSTYEVEVLIFSGMPNPRFNMNSYQLDLLNSYTSSIYRIKEGTNILGYNGIYIHELKKRIVAEPYAELYFLNLFKNEIDEEIYDHIKQRNPQQL
jgi:hypothetical protein